MNLPSKPIVLIQYCPKCNWLLRSSWMAQEILHTFQDDVGRVALEPSQDAGLFRIFVNDQLIWDRKENGGFPKIKTLKQKVRDLISPDRDLGHIDK